MIIIGRVSMIRKKQALQLITQTVYQVKHLRENDHHRGLGLKPTETRDMNMVHSQLHKSIIKICKQTCNMFSVFVLECYTLSCKLWSQRNNKYTSLRMDTQFSKYCNIILFQDRLFWRGFHSFIFWLNIFLFEKKFFQLFVILLYLFILELG